MTFASRFTSSNPLKPLIVAASIVCLSAGAFLVFRNIERPSSSSNGGRSAAVEAADRALTLSEIKPKSEGTITPADASPELIEAHARASRLSTLTANVTRARGALADLAEESATLGRQRAEIEGRGNSTDRARRIAEHTEKIDALNEEETRIAKKRAAALAELRTNLAARGATR